MEHNIMTDNGQNSRQQPLEGMRTDTRQKRLVIRVGQSSLSFSKATADGVTFVAYQLNSSISIAANLRQALQEEAILHESFNQTLVLVDTPVLMVPDGLFVESEQEDLYYHTFSRQDQQKVMNYVMSDLKCVVLFSVLKDLYTVCNDALSGVHFMPAIAPVWRHLHLRSYAGQRQKLFGYFHERRLEVFAFGQNRFKFFNSFAVNNPNDALYYILSVWKQLAMTPEHDELHLVGDIPEREVLMEEAQKFVKRVFYINPSGEFNRAAVTQLQDVPYDLMVLYVKGK